jgi:hypothetical protein
MLTTTQLQQKQKSASHVIRRHVIRRLNFFQDVKRTPVLRHTKAIIFFHKYLNNLLKKNKKKPIQMLNAFLGNKKPKDFKPFLSNKKQKIYN